jgi:hypothetical protein
VTPEQVKEKRIEIVNMVLNLYQQEETTMAKRKETNEGAEQGQNKANWREPGHNQRDMRTDEAYGRERDNAQGAFGDSDNNEDNSAADKPMKGKKPA